MYLVDSNVWLELLLEQDRASEALSFVEGASPGSLVISDFALHSIGVILVRRGRNQALRQFLDDLAEAETVIHKLSLDEIREVVNACEEFNLDFDDAYQYVAARNSGLRIVSFDRDFNRTDIERLLPSEVR